jgi:hypothetical protein
MHLIIWFYTLNTASRIPYNVSEHRLLTAITKKRAYGLYEIVSKLAFVPSIHRVQVSRLMHRTLCEVYKRIAYIELDIIEYNRS